jgi:hypothetical protein
MALSAFARKVTGPWVVSVCRAILVAMVFSAIGIPAQAQNIADLATYAGPDRTQRLVDGARRENPRAARLRMSSEEPRQC